MQYDDGANRTTDSDLEDADRSAIDESEVAQPDEQAAATDARGGSDKVWQGVQPVGGTEAVSEDPVTEDVAEDTHPTNVQPVTPDLGGIQPVDPDLGTGESVDDSSGTDTPEDPELAATGLDETDTEGSGPGTLRINRDNDWTDSDADRSDTDIDPSDEDADRTEVDSHPGDENADRTDVDSHSSDEDVDTSTTAGTAEMVGGGDNDDRLRAQWREAQHRFVDDPAGAVHEAAALVRAAAERASSATLAGSDTQSDPDTEWRRIMMQRYHEAFDLLVGISSRDDAALPPSSQGSS